MLMLCYGRATKRIHKLEHGGNRCNSDSSLEHDSPADPKMGALAAVLVENGPRSSASMANAFARGHRNKLATSWDRRDPGKDFWRLKHAGTH